AHDAQYAREYPLRPWRQPALTLFPYTTLFRSQEEGETVRVAGRLVGMRRMGKSTFAHIADRTGRIQAYFRINDLGEDGYALLDLDRKSTRLNSSHVKISYAVFCLNKKTYLY